MKPTYAILAVIAAFGLGYLLAGGFEEEPPFYMDPGYQQLSRENLATEIARAAAYTERISACEAILERLSRYTDENGAPLFDYDSYYRKYMLSQPISE